MDNNEEKLFVVIPAYNEQETIQQVIADWYSVVEGIGPFSRLVIVDDGSKDATYDMACSLANARPQLTVLTKENQGHGATLLFGYRYSLEKGADFIFQTDSDGQTLSEEFWPFWELRDEYDMIIVSRRERQDGVSRIVVTKVLKLVLFICFRVGIEDANTPYRLMKAEALASNIDLVPADFNLSNVILSVIYARKGLRVKYLPITFRPRQGGINSIDLKKIVGIGARALQDFWTLNRTFNALGF